MPHQVHDQLHPDTLRNISYGFFTNEKGVSDGGYVIAGKKTRNVNLFSPQTLSELPRELAERADLLDSAENVVSNLMACFAELSPHSASSHKFVMTSNYGKGGARVLSAVNADELAVLKRQSQDELSGSGLHAEMRYQLQKNNVSVIKADALVFKGIPAEEILVGGASGDAHPMVLMDDENKVCAYISGAHGALKEKVIEKTIEAMLKADAKLRNIRLVIGPGLGKRSYEFGKNAAEYLNVPRDKVDAVRDPEKRLLDIEKIVRFMAMSYLRPDQILDMGINTMGFDLYDEEDYRKTTVNSEALRKEGPLFFSARREIMLREGLGAENPGLHNTIGRHFAGVRVRG